MKPPSLVEVANNSLRCEGDCLLPLQWKVGDFVSGVRTFHNPEINPCSLKWGWRWRCVCLFIRNVCPRVFPGKQL